MADPDADSSDDETDVSELDGYAANNAPPKREEKAASAQPRAAAQPDQGSFTEPGPPWGWCHCSIRTGIPLPAIMHQSQRSQQQSLVSSRVPP